MLRRIRAASIATLCAFGSATAAAEGGLIEEIGLQGRIPGTPEPLALRVRVTNPGTTSQAVELVADVGSGRSQARATEQSSSVDRVSVEVSLGPRESRLVDVPIFSGSGDTVEVAVLDRSGRVLERDSRQLVQRSGAVVALLCAEEAVCQAAESRISFGGSEEDRVAKRRGLAFEFVRQPADRWWGWNPAHAVVVAAPLASLAAEQREALELYARHGGVLVLVEELVRDREFLSPYRATPTASPQALGLGRLYRAASVSGADFDAAFTGASLESLLQPRTRAEMNEPGWARKRLATSLDFPSLGWLMGCLVVYIVVVGPLNFWALRRLGHVEWAWVTVPIIAVAVGVVLYGASAARRPAELLVDQVAVEWMDDASPIAAIDLGVRLVSPARATATVPLPEFTVLMSHSLLPKDMFSLRQPDGGRRMILSRVPAIEAPVRQWSVTDIDFTTTRRRPGTVRRVGEGRIVNETGLPFTQAFFIDRESVRMLGTVGVGATVDLGTTRREPLRSHTGNCGPFPQELGTTVLTSRSQCGPAPGEIERLRARPFSLLELVRGWNPDAKATFAIRSAVFLGLATSETSPATPAGRRYTISVVSFAPIP